MINNLRQKMKALALADAIIEPEWQYRYFSYNYSWSEAEEMGSLRDGSGGEWFLWLSGKLAGYKCLSPEDGLMEDLEEIKSKIPSEYNPFITEPAFSMDTATCIWYLHKSKWEKHGKDVKWLIDLEDISNWTAKDYQSWAVEYYERDINLTCVEQLFENQFSEEIAKRLNPTIDISDLQTEIVEIGFNS